MKFKKDGIVFEDICSLWGEWCCARNCSTDCDIQKAAGVLRNSHACREYCENHPAEAARLMGYEVVKDESTVEINANKDESSEDNMDKQGKSCTPVETSDNIGQKPLKDWTPGEVKEHCSIRLGHCNDCLFRQHTCMVSDKDCPHEWDLAEKLRFTEEEVADARAIVRLFGPDGWTHIGKTEDGYPQLEDKDEESEMVVANVGISSNLFPSILPGQSVKLSEIIGEERP